MHPLYTGGKGDPLCPLGFHPQVRWPTRCKRCFRDYKDHGGKEKRVGSSEIKEDMTRSNPSLSSWTPASFQSGNNGKTLRLQEDDDLKTSKESFSFDSNRLSEVKFGLGSNNSSKSLSSSSSWTSTPDLGSSTYEDISTTVSVSLPKKRNANTSKLTETSTAPAEFMAKSPSLTSNSGVKELPNGKLQRNASGLDPKSNSKTFFKNTPSSVTSSGKFNLKQTLENGKNKETDKSTTKALKKLEIVDSNKDNSLNPDVEFILRVKSTKPEVTKESMKLSSRGASPATYTNKSSSGTPRLQEDEEEDDDDDDDDVGSTTNTDTTETTLMGKNDSELQEEVETLKNELEVMKARCERVEKEKSDILLRRLASFDMSSTKTTASEVLKLQKKVNELSSQSEDLKDDNKSLSLKVKELEKELEKYKFSGDSSKRTNELQAKLAAAETLCEDLMDENEEMKKELRELEEEIEEMQDNFREDQADEYSSLKKELEQTTKNCRILSFKLRKAERKAEQLEDEKRETELKYKEILDQRGVNCIDRVKTLESDLKNANELAAKLTKDLEETNQRLKSVENKKETSLSDQKFGNALKPGRGERVSRASLTRGGSQEDPQQLLRDLQDSVEREADLREQLRFAEEEAANLRKKVARVEEDNDSLALQLKKMATKAKSTRRSVLSSNNRSSRSPVVAGKDEETSDEEDPTELRLLLELNEQESTVLRKKIEDMETDAEKNKKMIKELEEKLASSSGSGSVSKKVSSDVPDDNGAVQEEMAELRKKVIEKNKEIKRLESEIQLSHKKAIKGHLIKSQSLDIPMEQKNLDFKRQLQLVEQEAAVLRSKINSLETENEKLNLENQKLQMLRGTKIGGKEDATAAKEKISTLEAKLSSYEKELKALKEKSEKPGSPSKALDKKFLSTRETEECDKLKKELKFKTDELEKMKMENQKFMEELKRLRETAVADAIDFYKSRKPKKPTDFTTKLQLRKMVEDLENEIDDVLVVLQRVHSEKGKVKPGSGSSSEIEERNKKILELEKQIEGSKKRLEKLAELEKEKEALIVDKKKLEAEINKLNSEKRNFMTTQDEIKSLTKKFDKDLELEQDKTRKLAEKLKEVEEAKKKLEQEVLNKTGNVTDAEEKSKELEEKLKKVKKNLVVSTGKILELEKCKDELMAANRDKDVKQKALEIEATEVKASNSLLSTKINDLENEKQKCSATIKALEESLRKERERTTDEHLKADLIGKKEITVLREDLSRKSKQLEELNERLEKMTKAKKAMEENQKKMEADITNCKNWEKKALNLEKELDAERKKVDRGIADHEKVQVKKEAELSELKSKIANLEKKAGISNKELEGTIEEWRNKYTKLEKVLKEENKKYEDLTMKYDLLEEEHVVTKAQLVLENEQAQAKLATNKREMTALEAELKNFQDKLSTKQEVWMKEKLELQEKMKVNFEKSMKAAEAKRELEKSKLQVECDEQRSLIEQLKHQNETVEEQISHMRKENEELKRKLDDFDKVAKIQRQISGDAQFLEKQLMETKEKLAMESKNHKSEMASLKLRYESRVNLISGELQASQNQVSRFKRERDTFKHMLEETRTQMAELKKGSSAGASEELKDGLMTMASLEQQISCLEDELSEARLECSKLRTELVSEKSAKEVKLTELQSRVNELEEEKILSSGRTKVAGLRTKIELAWQKEREDQQKLLQETSALARDLRQTLYEVERDRDKIKLESKRIHDQIKRAFEEETEENRKKMNELQCDLLELRDAHAKLRTTNEKLRREKEKLEKENRTLQKTRMRTEEEDRKFHYLLDNIDLLLKANFEKKSSTKFTEPSFKKSGSKSRESSPPKTFQDEIQLILQRLSETAEDIRVKMHITERPDDRSKRASSLGCRSSRAMSTESERSEMSPLIRRPVQFPPTSTLHRKSLSLSETANLNSNDEAIWKEINNGESFLSLDEQTSPRFKNPRFRENSMDSRLSGGSTQSEVISGEKKKKKGIFGRLKKLTKHKSVDDSVSSQEDITARGSDSDTSLNPKGKFNEIFNISRTSKFKDKKTSENRIESIHGSETIPAKVTAGRILDKSKNPAASHLYKP